MATTVDLNVDFIKNLTILYFKQLYFKQSIMDCQLKHRQPPNVGRALGNPHFSRWAVKSCWATGVVNGLFAVVTLIAAGRRMARTLGLATSHAVMPSLNYRKPDAWQDRAYTPIYGS